MGTPEKSFAGWVPPARRYANAQADLLRVESDRAGGYPFHKLDSRAVQRDPLWTALLVIGGLLALASLILGIVISFDEDWDSAGERALWLVFTVGGALLLAAGLWYASRSRTPKAGVLISVGAVLAGVGFFWSIIMPVAAIAVVVMTIMWLRRPTVAA